MVMSFDPFSDLNRVANALLQANDPAPRTMPVDLYREHDEYVLSADLPGIDPGSVDVDLDGQLLTIRAQRTSDSRVGSQWLAKERAHGSYLRQFSLGDGIDTNGISAVYDNGVLNVILPVSEKAKPRKIDVTTGSPAGSPSLTA